jgi:hypothetical protein
MMLLSAEDDFRMRTLAALPDALSRLAYVVELRNRGRYDHWGMIRTHGDAAAQSAIASNHTDVFAEVLATPLEDIDTQERNHGDGTVQLLRERMMDAVPDDACGGHAAHLSFVLESLWLLQQAERASTRQAA